MAKCMFCGKVERAMNCVCGECVDPTTNGGYILSKGLEGLAEMIIKAENLDSFWCKNLPECCEDLDSITDEKCMVCLMEWLRSKRDV